MLCLFIARMIKCRPEQRLAPSVAIQHTFLESADDHQSVLSLSDMMLLPTTTLLLDNIYPENGVISLFAFSFWLQRLTKEL